MPINDDSNAANKQSGSIATTVASSSSPSPSLSVSSENEQQRQPLLESRRYDTPPAKSLSSSSSEDRPLTVFVKHLIKPEQMDQYNAWVRKIAQIQGDKYPGFLGLEVTRPNNEADSNEVMALFRYDSYTHLQQWMESEDRQKFLRQTPQFDQAPIEVSYYSRQYCFSNTESCRQRRKTHGLEAGNGASAGCDAGMSAGCDGLSTTAGTRTDKSDIETGKKPGDATTTSSSSATGPPAPIKWRVTLLLFFVIWVQARFVVTHYARVPGVPEWAVQGIGILTIVFLTTYVVMPILIKYVFAWCLFPATQGQEDQSTGAIATLPSGGKDARMIKAAGSSSVSANEMVVTAPTAPIPVAAKDGQQGHRPGKNTDDGLWMDEVADIEQQ